MYRFIGILTYFFIINVVVVLLLCAYATELSVDYTKIISNVARFLQRVPTFILIKVLATTATTAMPATTIIVITSITTTKMKNNNIIIKQYLA